MYVANALNLQINELQEELQKKNRENEDTLGRLDSARQSLARATLSANSVTAKQLEGKPFATVFIASWVHLLLAI